MGRVLPGIVVSRLVRTTCLLAVLIAPRARAQNNQKSDLTIASGLSFPTPSIADYNRGYVCAGTVLVTDAINKGASVNDGIYVRSTASVMTSTPTPTYTIPVTDLQFTTSVTGCSAASAWTSVPVATSPPALMVTGATPFSATVYFRVLLSWTGDPGGVSYDIPDLRFWVNLPSANPP
jgi:hypothetical protein